MRIPTDSLWARSYRDDRIKEFGADVDPDSRPVGAWVCYFIFDLSAPIEERLSYLVQHISKEPPPHGDIIYSRPSMEEALRDMPIKGNPRNKGLG